MGATNQRDISINAASQDFRKALVLARQTGSAWFRCQALAWVARFAPEAEVVKIAEEAILAALSAYDPYHVVGASAWPLRALIERGYEQRILRWLPKLLQASQNIANPVSRFKALSLVWQAVYPASSSSASEVLERLISACLSADSWQAGVTMREVALVVARGSMSEANQLISSMPEGVYKRQAQRRLAEGQQGHIRAFFWQK